VTVTEKAGSNVAATRDANLRELIISLYGLYARTQNNWFSIAALVRLMGDLGADEPSVRSSIYRLKQRGVLDAVKVDSAAGYALSASSIQSFAEGDVRIFGRRRATVEDGWLLLVFSIPETQRDKRHELRTQLFRLNFGTAAPGTWIAPGNLHEETRDMLERHGLTNFVDIFRGDHLAFGDLRTKVQSWWEFDDASLRSVHHEIPADPQAVQQSPISGPGRVYRIHAHADIVAANPRSEIATRSIAERLERPIGKRPVCRTE
jgi:phenylacetic acid degradation operon negative regulatory protein